MKKTYECMVLLDNKEVKKGWQSLKDMVSGLFKKHGGEVLSAKRWDERRLMYPVAHCKRGTYLLVYFQGEALQTNMIRRELELNEQVLRHLMLSCEEVPATAYDAEAAFDESALSVEDTPPVEAAAPIEVAPGAGANAEAASEKASAEKASTEKASTEKASTEKAAPESTTETTPAANAGGEKK